MGILQNWLRKKNQTTMEIIDYIMKFKAEYFEENGYDARDLEDEEIAYATKIFWEANSIVNTVGSRNINKELSKTKAPLEYVALNFIANTAMMHLKDGGSVRDMIKRTGPGYQASAIYEFANQKKLDLNYISQEQYDENKQLMFKIMTNPFDF